LTAPSFTHLAVCVVGFAATGVRLACRAVGVSRWLAFYASSDSLSNLFYFFFSSAAVKQWTKLALQIESVICRGALE
jgi:hypothetical protein